MTPSPRCASWARAAVRELTAATGELLWLLVPGTCVACGLEAGGGLCRACLSRCAPPRGPACTRCGAPWTRTAAREGWCGRCLRFGRPFAFDAAVALWHYRRAARRLVHGFKYRGRREVLGPLGARLAGCARAAPLVADRRQLVVVPVPARAVSRRERGYDQARELARGVADALRIPLEVRALRRRRQPTAPQAGTPGERRRRQLRAGFRARRARVAGRRVLLVDDVVSTGATADAAARALRTAGARWVGVLALAS